ncbi:MAG: hypothetical protein V3R56_05865 [Xanthomonadales bacterium]
MILLTALAVTACAGVSQKPTSTEATGERPLQQAAPGAPPAPTAPAGPARIRGIAVPSQVDKHPNAVYRRIEPAGEVAFPAFERPTTSANSLRGKGMPLAQSTTLVQGGSAEPNSWTGSSGGFDGTGWGDNGTETGFVFIPPDPHAAAGPDHLVSVVNVMIQIRDKYTGASLFLDSLQDFFTGGLGLGGLGTDGPETFTFDPKVLYDQYEDRWVVITLEQTGRPSNTSRMFVAVSDDENPMGDWYMTVFDSSITIGRTEFWADYPGFAVDDQAIYITANLFSFRNNSSGGVRLWIIDKDGGLYDGDLGVVTVAAHDPYDGNEGLDMTTQPTHMYGTAPGTLGTFLVGFSGLHFDSGPKLEQEIIQVVTVENPLGTPTFTLQFVDTGDIETNNTALPDAAQSGTSTKIEVNDRRTLDAVWRNNSLWLTTTILPFSEPNLNETTAYWVEIDTTDLATPNLVLSDQGEIGGEDIAAGTFTFFPSIAVDSLGNMVTGFSASDGSIFPGAYFVTRSPGDTAGATSDSQIVKEGVAPYVRTFGGTRNRWGDYSAAVVDSARGCFWVYNEWADTEATSGAETGRWGTAYAKTCTCAQPLRSIPASKWESIALPCNPWPANLVQDVFPQLDPAGYQSTWGVAEYDTLANQYRFLALTEEMLEGRGYWIFSEVATTAQTDGSPQAGNDIPLTGASTGQFNLLGNHQNGPVDWKDFLVMDGGTPYTLDQADPLDTGPEPDINECDKATPGPTCRMSRIMHKWNGSGYDTFDGGTPGMEGNLAAYDNFWVKAFKDPISLRSPTIAATAASAAKSGTLAASTETAATQTSPATTQAGKPGGKKIKFNGWYVRLIASADGKQSRGNVFGQLSDSTDGLDRHDLGTLAPFGDSYLSVLFTNPLLGEADWGFVSDYRALTKKPAGAWPFVVRASSDVGAVTLSWEGEDRLFKKAWLLDEQTGVISEVKPGGSYTFTMDSGGESHFTIMLE